MQPISTLISMHLLYTSGRGKQNGRVTYRRRYQLLINPETRELCEKYGLAPVWTCVRAFLQSIEDERKPPDDERLTSLLNDLINPEEAQGMVIEHYDYRLIADWEPELIKAIRALPAYWSDARMFGQRSGEERFF